MLELDCHCATFRQATRAITQLYDNYLRPCDLKITQFTILRMLCRHPDLARIADLTGALLIDDTTLTRSLLLMKQNGWVESFVGDVDRRERRLRITRRGRALVARAEPLWEAAQAAVNRYLGRNDAKVVHKSASRLASALSEEGYSLSKD